MSNSFGSPQKRQRPTPLMANEKQFSAAIQDAEFDEYEVVRASESVYFVTGVSDRKRVILGTFPNPVKFSTLQAACDTLLSMNVIRFKVDVHPLDFENLQEIAAHPSR